MNIKFLQSILILLVLLGTGCKSEIDKCTDSQMKANGPYDTKDEHNGAEAHFRMECLKANAGKQ
jgi:hypothetical protein